MAVTSPVNAAAIRSSDGAAKSTHLRAAYCRGVRQNNVARRGSALRDPLAGRPVARSEGRSLGKPLDRRNTATADRRPRSKLRPRILHIRSVVIWTKAKTQKRARLQRDGPNHLYANTRLGGVGGRSPDPQALPIVANLLDNARSVRPIWGFGGSCITRALSWRTDIGMSGRSRHRHVTTVGDGPKVDVRAVTAA